MGVRTLHTILNNFQKPELEDLASLLGRDLSPRLRKAQLVADLDSYLHGEPTRWMSFLTERDARLLKELVHAGPEKIQYQDFADYPSLLEVTGLVQYDDSDENYHKVWISRELYEIVSPTIDYVIHCGEESGQYDLERVALGYLNLYGIVPTEVFVDLMMDWFEEKYPDGSNRQLTTMLHRSTVIKLNRFSDAHGDYLCSPCVENIDETFARREELGKKQRFDRFSTQDAREAGSGAPYFRISMKSKAGMALEEMLRRVGYDGFELVKAEHDVWIESQYMEDGVNADPLFQPLVDSPMGQELDSDSWLACCEIIVKYANSVPRWVLCGAPAENSELFVNWDRMKRQMQNDADLAAQAIESSRVNIGPDEYPHWTMPEPTITEGYASELDSDFLPLGFAIPHVAPNDPCPCGSGLRYCRCHGKYLS